MSKVTKQEKISPFYLQGRLVGFFGDFGEKTKRLRVAVAEGELYIKLAKELRYSLRELLQPGDWIEIFGEKKLKPKTGELKLKAFQVKLATPLRQQSLKELETGETGNIPEGLSTSLSFAQSPTPNPESFVNPSPVAASKTKACVMVCQKSSCRKRGADAVCQAITESLR